MHKFNFITYNDSNTIQKEPGKIFLHNLKKWMNRCMFTDISKKSYLPKTIAEISLIPKMALKAVDSIWKRV